MLPYVEIIAIATDLRYGTVVGILEEPLRSGSCRKAWDSFLDYLMMMVTVMIFGIILSH